MFRFRSPPWREVTFWALDLETSGTDPRRDAILSVGMVPIRQGIIEWGQRYYSLVRPPRDYPLSAEAMRVHHILPEEVAEAPALSVAMGEISKRLAEGPVLLHYAKMDLAFLQRGFPLTGRYFSLSAVVDTVRLLSRLSQRLHMIQPSAESLPIDLAGARAAMGLPPHLHHHALYDALATAELFLALRARLALKTLRQLR